MTLPGELGALLAGAAFAFRHWPFERELAKAAMDGVPEEVVENLTERVLARWREHLAAEGLWDGGPGLWTRELIRLRQETRVDFSLSDADWALMAHGLRVCALEFIGKRGWGEFCVATPGNLDWYSVAESDLTGLADRIESWLAEPE